MSSQHISLDQVLDAFAAERDTSGETLQRYLRKYPQFAEALIDFSHEIFQFSQVDEDELLDADRARVQSALAQFRTAASRAAQAALTRLAPEKQRELAGALGVPRQVILAFVERSVIVSSVPRRFLARMADALRSSAQDLAVGLSQPPQRAARFSMADKKPQDVGLVSFEQLLRDAGISEPQIAQLLRDEP